MKRFLLATMALTTVMSVSAGDDTTKKPQIIGGDFEKWHTATYDKYSSQEPDGWHSFMSAKPGNPTYARACWNTHTYTSNEVRPGSTGKQSIKLTSGMVDAFFSNNQQMALLLQDDFLQDLQLQMITKTIQLQTLHLQRRMVQEIHSTHR